MTITPPPGLVRGKGRFNVRTFRAVSVELNNQQRDIDELFDQAASSGTSGAAVQDLAALRAIAEADRTDKQVRLVEDAPGGTGLGAIYRFDATGVGADDGDLTIVPTAGSGRWFKTSNVEGGFFASGAGTNSAIGKGAVAPTAAGVNSFAQGDGCVAAGADSFAQGKDNVTLIYGGYSAQGIFAQGLNNYVYTYQGDSFGVFVQGRNNNLFSDYLKKGVFCQGESNTVQGYDNHFAQGSNNTITQPSDGVLLQGFGNLAKGSTVWGFAQGASNILGGNYDTFAQGDGNKAYGYASFAQGNANDVLADYSFAQGDNNTISAAKVNSFAQGSYNQVSGLRGFAQGAFAHVKFDDSKMWGTNRAVLGKAQSGKVGKHLNTTDATADQVIASIPLDASSVMLLEAAVVGRGPNTKVLWTDRILIQVYRDSAGNAIINGAPSFTTTLVGFTTAAVAAPAVSGGTIELKVTGEAATVIDWTAELKIIETVT